MKVLFDCNMPSQLAHGGMQIQAFNTVEALLHRGVDVDYLRWWDPAQQCEVLHFLGRASTYYMHFAQVKGIKFVLADLLTSQGSRNRFKRIPHWTLRQVDRATGGKVIAEKCGWNTYRLADAVIALTPWEKHLMITMYGADPEKIHVVPNGVEEVFFQNPKSTTNNPKSPWLVCVASITERKRVLELAQAAIIAQTPVWIIGKPYSDSDPYFLRFLQTVQESAGLVKYQGSIEDRQRIADIYKSAHGFVLLSTMESLSLSALEATAAECPLLLTDLPWARTTFGKSAFYAPIAGVQETSWHLKRFYYSRDVLPKPPRPATWHEVAEMLREIYVKILQ